MTKHEAQRVNLSANFTLWEFLKSDQAEKNGLMEKQLQIPTDKVVNLAELCNNVLQPVRNKYRIPITILSGYRCEELNAITEGSSSTSDHPKGKAADITCNMLSLVVSYIRDYLDFDQLIYYRDRNFAHVSYRKIGNRKQVIYR